MAFVHTDWTILRSSGANPYEIDYVGDAHAGASPSYATGIELHRALQDFADDQADGTEEISIVDQVPSQRGGVDTNITLVNGYHITPTAAEHLYDTSISQVHPVDGEQIYDGIQVFGNSTSIQVIQDGARLTNDFWNEAKMIAAVSDSASSTTHRFMVLVRDAGADIDGRRLIGTQRVYGTVYTEFSIGGGTNRGNNVLALTANSNLNNGTAQGTIDALTFTITEGYVGIDGDGNGTPENYYIEWRVQSPDTKNDAYEYSQNMIREGVSSTPVNGTFGLDPNIFRGITHSVALSGGAGTWVEPESLSWGTGATAGTGQLLAVDNTAASSSTILYMQLLTGVLPNANTITGNGGATATAGTVQGQVISIPPIGASTGANIKGAYGVGINESDLAAGDTLIDLTGTANNAPNNVSFDVIGLNITTTADYVLVGPDSGGDLDVAQLGQNAALNAAATTSVVMDSPIPSDTPATGTIRMLNESGEYVRHTYSAWSGSTFTIASYDFSVVGLGCDLGANVFISYIDKVATATTESFNTVYSSTRALRVIVRNGATVADIAPIIPIDTAGSLGSGGGATTLSRQLDT